MAFSLLIRRISTLHPKISNISRNISTTICRQDMFNIQDEDDFKKRVLGSDIPVVVDFHAQ